MNIEFLVLIVKLDPKIHLTEMLENIKPLRVVKDRSEIAVKLTQNYANILTKDKDQKLYLLQCIKMDFQNSYEK